VAGAGDGQPMAEGRATMDEVPFSVPGAAVTCCAKTALVQQKWVSPKAPPPHPPCTLASLLDPTFGLESRTFKCCGLFVVGVGPVPVKLFGP
jgi:hypothetical protein